MGYLWDIFGISLRYLWDIFEISLGYLSDIFGISLGYLCRSVPPEFLRSLFSRKWEWFADQCLNLQPGSRRAKPAGDQWTSALRWDKNQPRLSRQLSSSVPCKTSMVFQEAVITYNRAAGGRKPAINQWTSTPRQAKNQILPGQRDYRGCQVVCA